MTQQELMVELEKLVDKSGVADVLLALARVCNEKAEHIQINWQDAALAGTWDRDARTIDKLTERIKN